MENSEMPLTEHLSELRKRILISVAVVGLGFIAVFNFSEHIFHILTFPLRTELTLNMVRPYIHAAQKTAATNLIFLSPAEAFWMHLKISFVAAFVLSSPVLFYQLWLFISPGLIEKEKKYLIPFIFSSTMLFLIGALFCFIIVLPFAMTFLLGYKTENLTPMLSVGNYIDFCLKFILAFGAIFELPLLILFLTRFGIVTTKTLAKHRKYAVLASFVLAAILTPTPDAFNQTLMALPIIILYEIGILVSRLAHKKVQNG